MRTNLKAGELLADRFALQRVLGRSALGTVWEAIDVTTQTRCVVKLYATEADSTALTEYTDYLQRVHELLADAELPCIRMPIQQGVTAGHFYEVFRYLGNARSLNQVISQAAPMAPLEVLGILGQIATGLSALHEHSIVHSDIKPANILLTEDGTTAVYITDFGMAQVLDADGGTLIMGTQRYIHPDLVLGKSPGPYIDIYSAGLVTIAMLTGSPEIPVPLTEAGLSTVLAEKNPQLRRWRQQELDRLVNLLFQMLAVRADREGISADMVRSIAASLAVELQAEHIEIDSIPAPTTIVMERVRSRKESALPDEFQAVLQRIASIAEDLQASTAALFARAGQLTAVPSPQRDEAIVNEVNVLFENALRRTQTAWRIGLAMTIVSFLVITVMIVSAVTLSITTGKGQWALIFGGLSIPLIIGTLIWRPYDRVFRATILIQQIELVHVQTTAGFRGTLDVDERMRICREGILALQTIFRDHAAPEKVEVSVRRSRGRRRTGAGAT